MNDFVFKHGVIRRRPLPNRPTRVLRVYTVGDTSDVMLMVSKDWGTRSEYLNMDVIRRWMSEHHPQHCIEVEGGTLDVDLTSLDADVLDPCLAHARAEWRKEHPLPNVETFEIGTLFDPAHDYTAYMRNPGRDV